MGTPEVHEAEVYAAVSGWKSWSPRYRRADTGEIFAHLSQVPPGAMWDADWLHDVQGGPFLMGRGADGRVLPNDDQHRCWVRHGEPPDITVDKNGVTCSAGGGSIQSGNYHGFLRNGEFTE